MSAEAFGAKLKELRERAGLTQKQLAERAGVAQRTVSSLEQARYEPVWSTAIALAQALNVSCEDFLQEPTERPPPSRGRPPKPKAEPAAEKSKRSRGRPRKQA